MNKTCPKCAADYNGKPALKESRYWCGSSKWDDGDFYQSPECVRRERDQLLDQLLAQNRELVEALEALLDCISETRGKNATVSVMNARAILAKHKEPHA